MKDQNKLLIIFCLTGLVTSCNMPGSNTDTPLVSSVTALNPNNPGNPGNPGNPPPGGGTGGGGGGTLPPINDGFKAPTLANCEQFRNATQLDDTYLCEQWHLHNRGQLVKKVPGTSTYSTAGTAGVDLKTEVALKNYDGAGVKVYVTDDGLWSSHPDIAPNFIGGFNNCTDQNNSEPRSSSDNHGTMVSGIIAAKGGNGIGVAGVSHQAKVFANNYISCQVGTSKFLNAINVNGYNLWSGSFGIPACNGYGSRSSNQAIYAAYTAGANKNVTYFKANGNDWGRCRGNGNSDPSNTHYAVASIAALGNKGEVTTYSTRGANLLAGGFGGYGGSSSAPGIVTISGTNTYTSSFNGTSAATPSVTGAVGLLIEAVPGLKWYDYQSIIFMTANKLRENEKVPSPVSGVDDIESVVNAAGHVHSFNAGAGAVNIGAAIDYAKNGHKALPELINLAEEYNGDADFSSDTTPAAFAAGGCASKTVKITKNNFQIFSLELSFDIQISQVKNLMVLMTMPGGKTAQIVRTSSMPGSNLNYGQYFKSMQAFGMDVSGDWSFKVCGVEGGSFRGVKLDAYGFDGAPLPKR
jgi:hypothetical protein